MATSTAPTTNGATNASASNGAPSASSKIIFYTNYDCPWAQRVNITLLELGLEYETVPISLDEARPAWYLEINPRGLVPALSYNGEIILESSVITYFLADAHPSPLLPPSNHAAPTGALARARIAFFVDTFMSKIQPLGFAIFRALPVSGPSSSADPHPDKDRDQDAAFDAAGTALVDGMRTHIEPQLASAAPFFDGSAHLTLAEALTAPFVMRLGAMVRGGMHPASLQRGLAGLEHYSRWERAVLERASVRDRWDEARVVEGTRKRLDKFRKM